jgi:ketosteroid isomerase-like protein
MSANLDLVRSIYAAWDRGDYSSADWAHPEIEFVIADGPDPGSWTGPAALVEGTRVILNAWEGWRTEVQEYREVDDECVLVLLRFSGRGKTSGLEVGQVAGEGANVHHVHGGKVTRLVLYWSRDRAFADLGMAE